MNPQTLSTSLSRVIVKHSPEFKRKEDHIRYGLEWTISGILQISTILIVATVLGILVESLVFLFVGMILRSTAGGIHFKKHMYCYIYSTLSVIGLAFISKLFIFNVWSEPYVFIGLVSTGLFITFIRAPRLYVKKKCFTTKQKAQYKYISMLLFISFSYVSWIMVDVSIKQVIQLALMHQIFVLTNIGEYTFIFTEKILGGNIK